MTDLPDCLYAPSGDDVYVPTGLTIGPWDRGAQHGGPPAALLAHGVERVAGVGAGQVVRFAFDILRPVPVAPLRLAAEVVRGGKRVELVEARLTDAEHGTLLMRCAAWRLRAEPVALPGGLGAPDPPPPGPEGLQEGTDFGFWDDPVSYRRGLEWRWHHGSWIEPGPSGVWTRMRVPLVRGRATTPVERLLVMADAASGASAALPWGDWTFVNVELGLHLERPPSGEWVSMDAVTRFGDRGAAQCEAVLADVHGRVGRSTAALLVAPR